jgi:hypothetical protein
VLVVERDKKRDEWCQCPAKPQLGRLCKHTQLLIIALSNHAVLSLPYLSTFVNSSADITSPSVCRLRCERCRLSSGFLDEMVVSRTCRTVIRISNLRRSRL